MRKRGLFSAAVILVVLFSFGLSYGQSQQITNGLVYLSTSQNPDGSWGSDTSGAELLPSTVSVMETFQLLGQASTANYSNALTWLQSQGLDTTDYLSERIHALSIAGTDNTLLLSYLDEFDYAWGGYDDFDINTLDTALALQALSTVNYSDSTVINSAIAYLISSQNSDGGWGLCQSSSLGCPDGEGDSNVYMTALVSSTLQRFPQTTAIATAINKATAYLLSHQNADGGFGAGATGVSTIYETSLAYIALLNTGQVSNLPLQNAINYLTSTQFPDGSWEDDPYSTALALRVLNWNIVPPPGPTTGSIKGKIIDGLTGQPLADLSATITGYPALNTTTDASGDFVIEEIPAGSRQITLSLSGYKTATATVNVVGGSVINLGTISLFASPTTGTIKGTVTDAATGLPLSGATITVAGAYAGTMLSAADGSFAFTSVTPGTVTLTASMAGYYTVAGTGSVSAGSTLFFNPRLPSSPPPPTAPDLSISSGDITFSNPAPTVAVTAVIHNTGFNPVGNVFVQFFDGDPLAGGQAIAETTIASIPANSASSLTLNWTVSTSGTHRIFVVVDPLNAIEEQSKADNTASANLAVASLPDLSITTADIAFSPASPKPGDTITITGTIRNLGETTASNVTIDMYDGDPSTGGVKLYGITVPSIGGGGSFTLQVSPSLAAGNHNIYVLVDRLNSVPESSDSNNTAMKSLQFGGDIDLAISASDITFAPVFPTEGDTVTIKAIVHNEGDLAASDVLVRFYLGNPAAGGIQIGSDAVISKIQARSNATVTALWDSTGRSGNNDIYVMVDPLDAISELSEGNNEAFQAIKVAARTGPDLAMTVADLDFSPLNPTEGDIVTITANVRNMGNVDASNVLVEFSLGDPAEEGTLIIGSRVIPSISQGSAASVELSFNTTNFAGTFEVYANADPFNEIAELNEQNNSTHLSLTIAGPQGPDLTTTLLDTASVITDTQTLAIAGSIGVTIENKGNQATAVPFEIIAFEDRNGNKTLDPGVDNILGSITYSIALDGGTTDMVAIPVAGEVLFRDDVIYVQVDSGHAIQEMDETNNMRSTGQQCEYAPPVGSFNPVEKWSWTQSPVLPTWLNVMMTPVVIDINQDGIPDVVFGSTSYTGGASVFSGVLRALDGRTGAEIFTVTDQSLYINPACSIAVGDTDLDGLPEIIACDNSGYRVIAFDHNGNFKWRSQNFQYLGVAALNLADINGDGRPEIIVGRQVLDASGKLLWTGTGGSGTQLSLVADVNLDGRPEVIAGNTAYDNGGNLLWRNASVSDGKDAVGNFDGDPYPEVVVVGSGSVWLLDHTGKIIWGPKGIPGGGNGGAPTIADYDGDGYPEIGVAGAGRYVVFKSDGTILWQSVTSDYSSNVTGSSVFDFDGDGKAEVVYRDEHYLRVYQGTNGTVLFQTPMSSCTWFEYVLVADIDGDNKAEMVAVANNNCGFGPQRGVHVFGDADNNWVNTRSIWNEYSYHITNINDDGSIPKYEKNSWETYNTYRCNSMLKEQALATADITTSSISMDQTSYPASVLLTARIGNGGAASQVSAVDIVFYNGNPEDGGVLIGTAQTSKTIIPGEYEDVSVIWNNPPLGQQTIYVAADKGQKLHECRIDNNIDSSAFNILPIEPPPPLQTLPDLEISASDVTIMPAGTIEGQPAMISATVHNIGDSDAQDVNISFYDGDPMQGGILIGGVTKAYIEAGAAAFAEVPWDTIGQAGRNYVHVVVDPQDLINESNENNNSTLVPVNVTAPTLPDLAVTSTDITASNLNPKEGVTLTIASVIHNLGTEVRDAVVRFYDGDPATGGELVSQRTISQSIPFGGSAMLTFSVDTLGKAGTHRFYISVDPDNLISEVSEDNNITWNTVIIGTSGLSLAVSTDKTSYTANEDVQITVGIANLQAIGRAGSIDVKIVDLANNVVSTVTTARPLSLAADESKNLSFTWNTGQTLAGSYKVFADFIESGIMVAKADAPLAIVPDIPVTSKITTDKISYRANEAVTITSAITSLSANYIFSDLTAKIAISSQLSADILYEDVKSVGILAPGQLAELNTYWNTVENPEGTYTVTLTVLDGAAVLSTSSATFQVLGTSATGDGLAGTLTASPSPVFQGKDETFTYTVTNRGNEDLPVLGVTILIVDPDTQEVKQTFSMQGSADMGATISGSQPTSTVGLSPKIYLAILQAKTPDMQSPKTLAKATFEVKPGLDVRKTIPDLSRVLVWLDYQWQSGQGCPDRALIEQALNDAGVSYQIVLDKKDFETELRNPFHTDFLILGDQFPIEDHFSEELREQVYSGKGLIVSMFERQNLDAEVFGIGGKSGLTGSDYPIELLESDISGAGIFQSSGDALKVDALDPLAVVGWIVETTKMGTSEYPAIIERQYGAGNVLYYAFDLGMSSGDYGAFASLLKNSLNYVHKPLDTAAIGPRQLVPVETTLTSRGAAFDLKVTESYPSALRLYAPATNAWVTDNPWIMDVHLEPDETKTVVYYALTPDEAGTFSTQTEVGYVDGGVYNFYQTLTADITVEKDIPTVTGDILSGLNALTLSGQQKAKADNAIKYLQNVQTRTITDMNDVEMNISDLLNAVDSILFITDSNTSDIRFMIDSLLEYWEAAAYDLYETP